MNAREFLNILTVAEKLKSRTRHCYTSEGRHESVAEHSWRIALMVMLMSHEEEYRDVNMDKVIRMCLIHDLGEIFTGDIPTFEKNQADEDVEGTLLNRWIETFPQDQKEEFQALFKEMDELETVEAKLYKALDKMEAVIQHNESDLSTWLPLEYDLQFTYGKKQVEFSPYMKELKMEIDKWTAEKIKAKKKLGFGFMRLPLLDKNDDGSIDIEQVKQMVDIYMERGFTYFDTAWNYCSGKSECAIKEAIVDRYPRNSFTITTKLPSFMLTSFEDRDKLFNEQLEKTGAEYFDYYFLHDTNEDTLKLFNKYDCFTWLKEKKAQGLVKKIGFSFHDSAELLDKLLTEHPEIDVVQIQLNYLDWENVTVQSRKCYETATKHGKPVFVMEPAKGGTLARVPAEVEAMFKEKNPEMSVPSWAIRFAASLDNVQMVLSGMSTIEQVRDNTAYMGDFKPLTENEIEMCHKAADMINSTIAVPCTGCSYCVPTCPMNIPIPKYFGLYNANLQEIEGKSWTAQTLYYTHLKEIFGKASDCIKCGKCETMCPQHLPIREYMEDVAEHFEG